MKLDFSQVSFNKIMLNVATPQGEGLNFNKGEILKGLVQEVRDDGLVMLYIKGKLIEAASEIMVKSGQQLYLMVDEYRNGRTYLKVVTPQMMNEIENNNLSASLRDQGLASSPENVQMARKLLDYNLPVTASNLNTISREIKLLGGYNPRNLEIAAFALSRNIAAAPSTLSSLAQFVSSRGNEIVSLMDSLAQIFNRLNAENPMPLTTATQAASPNPQQSVPTGTVISPMPSGQEPNVAAAALRDSEPAMTVLSPTADVGETDMKANLVLDKPALNSSDRPNITLSWGQSMDITPEKSGSGALPAANMAAERNIKDIFSLVQKLFDAMILRADASSADTAQKLAAIIKSEPEIIKNLQVAGNIAKNIKADAANAVLNEITSDLISRLEGMEKEITGQRLFNITARLPGENIINGYYFAIPVQIKNQLHLCQLKIHRDAKKPLPMQDNIRFIVSLDTRNLGMVLFHVEWKRRGELNLQGVVENVNTLAYLNSNKDSLITNLQALGYQVNFAGIKLAGPDEVENLRPQLHEKPETQFRPFSIDVIV